jgi:hypothetical protein
MTTTLSNEMALMQHQADLAAHIQWLKNVADGKTPFYGGYINQIVNLIGIDASLIYFRNYERTLEQRMYEARADSAQLRQEIIDLKHTINEKNEALSIQELASK